MNKRVLGRTGEKLSVIGFGGIVVMDTTPKEAASHVAQAINRGINYFDVAPSYGNAEEMLGPALKPYRDNVFLACKTTERSAAGALDNLNRSLQLLHTDHIDLYQHHAVTTLEEVDEIMAPGGAMETFLDARDRGVIRHIGFSAHGEEAALRLMNAYDFDSILMPINMFCWRDGGFGPRAMERALDKGMGVLALKALARRPLREDEEKKWTKCWYSPIDTAPEARAALSFTLSHSVTAAVSPGHAELLWMACDAVEAIESDVSNAPQDAIVEGEPLFRTA